MFKPPCYFCSTSERCTGIPESAFHTYMGKLYLNSCKFRTYVEWPRLSEGAHLVVSPSSLLQTGKWSTKCSPCVLPRMFSAECAVDLVESCDPDKACRINMSESVTACHLWPHNAAAITAQLISLTSPSPRPTQRPVTVKFVSALCSPTDLHEYSNSNYSRGIICPYGYPNKIHIRSRTVWHVRQMNFLRRGWYSNCPVV
jgi:hypothetical protein